jgi:hypothetical protein
MHVCPECGKSMATAGGLEIHAEMAHAAPPSAPATEPVDLVPADLVRPDIGSVAGEPRPQAWPPMPDPSAASSPAKIYKPMLRGFDPTIPLTAILIVAMLLAGIAAAVGRSANEPAAQISAPAITAWAP